MQTQSAEMKITEVMMSALSSTKPWAKFLSVLGFVGTGFILLAAVVILFLQNFLPQAKNAPAILISLMYIVLAAFYFFPSFYLFKYSSSIGRFLQSRSEFDMESALSYQKSFWKFVGITTLVTLILAVLGVIAAIAIPQFIRIKSQGI